MELSRPRSLYPGEEILVNLASKEYARTVLPYLPEEIHCVTPVFGELEGGGRVVEKGVYVKMARGEMVRFLAEGKQRIRKKCRPFSDWDTISVRNARTDRPMSFETGRRKRGNEAKPAENLKEN